MKEGIHPQYGAATIRCACGNVIETRSTHQGTIQVDLCASCHPFFTGKQKLIDTAGRIDRFKKKFGDKVNIVSVKKEKVRKPEPEKMKLEKPVKEEKADKAEKK